MTVEISRCEATVTVTVAGRLDTMTAPELQGALAGATDGAAKLVFDFAGLQYISSAGLRVLLAMNKQMMSGGGELAVVHANQAVKDVFEMTGFSDIFSVS